MGYRRSVELMTWIQTRGPEYDDQEVKPFHQDEWPVPRGYPFPTEDRGFVSGSPLIVIATHAIVTQTARFIAALPK